MRKSFDWIREQQWAIQPASLDVIMSIAERLNDSPGQVSAKIGKPLQKTRTVENRDGVAVIPVTGPIMRYANMFTEISGATSLQVLAQDFDKALNDPNIKSIVLNIDSPGGQSQGVDEFSTTIYNARKIKPIVAYVEALGASAAYNIASACSEVVISESALLGSVGVILAYSKTKNDTEGVIVSSQSPNKNMDLNTDSGLAEMQKVIDKLASVFIKNVARNRGVSIETVISDFGKGGVLVGSDAIDAGMADKIGSFESLISELQKTDSKTVQAVVKETLSMDLSALKSEHPALYSEVLALGVKEGFELGAAEERARVQAIEALPVSGHQDLVQKLKFDGKSTAADVSLAILMAEKSTREKVAESILKDAPEPLPPVKQADDRLVFESTEEGWKAEFNAKKSLQDDFSDENAYVAYKKLKKIEMK